MLVGGDAASLLDEKGLRREATTWILPAEKALDRALREVRGLASEAVLVQQRRGVAADENRGRQAKHKEGHGVIVVDAVGGFDSHTSMKISITYCVE